MQFLLIIFLLWFTPAHAKSGQQLATVEMQSTATEFSARKRHRAAPVVEEFRWPWDEVAAPVKRVRTVHNRQSHKQRYRHGYVTQTAAAPTFGGGDLVSIARSQIGNGAIYGRARLWCARFMNYVVERAGYRGTGSDMASSFARYGTRVSAPQIGAIAVMTRRGGGHVGVVSGVDARGNPIIISGNHGRTVAESKYPASRVYAYVVPR